MSIPYVGAVTSHTFSVEKTFKISSIQLWNKHENKIEKLNSNLQLNTKVQKLNINSGGIGGDMYVYIIYTVLEIIKPFYDNLDYMNYFDKLQNLCVDLSIRNMENVNRAETFANRFKEYHTSGSSSASIRRIIYQEVGKKLLQSNLDLYKNVFVTNKLNNLIDNILTRIMLYTTEEGLVKTLTPIYKQINEVFRTIYIEKIEPYELMIAKLNLQIDDLEETEQEKNIINTIVSSVKEEKEKIDKNINDKINSLLENYRIITT